MEYLNGVYVLKILETHVLRPGPGSEDSKSLTATDTEQILARLTID
jgi:hypothetical protein